MKPSGADAAAGVDVVSHLCLMPSPSAAAGGRVEEEGVGDEEDVVAAAAAAVGKVVEMKEE